jgi:Flp pilus assembly protein TadG
MISWYRKLWRNNRGNALAIAAACLPLFVGAAGLASDTIQWTLWKRQLQRAADSAAIAAVYNREANNGSTSGVAATVAHDLTLNLHTFYALKTGLANCSGTCTITYPADSGSKTEQVEVGIAIQQPLSFSSLFMSSAPTITASARAALIPAGGDACVNARETSGSLTGINITGSAGIYMPDCVMYSNSPSVNSAAAGGSSAVTAEAVAGVGGIQQSNNWNVQSYRPYSPPIADPFANVTPDPSQMHCSTDTLDYKTKMSDYPSNTNCFASINVGSNKSVNLDTLFPSTPRVIYVNGGDVNVQGNLTCTECTIVLTNTSTASNATIGQFSSNAGANVNMTSPTSGTFTGIALYQDRRATDKTPGDKINGNNSSIIQGALYFPSQELTYNGDGTTNAICTMFVARRVIFSGNNATTNKFKKLSDCSAYGFPSGSSTFMVRLVG